MKAVKIIFAVAVLVNGFAGSGVFGQSTETLGRSEKSGGQTAASQINPATQNIKSGETISEAVLNSDDANGKSSEKYRIGYQDTIEVTVFRHPELSQTISVSSDGTINMPRIEQPIVAVCKTEGELKQTIENLYKTYLRSPFVNVRSVDQKSQPFAVIGAVEKPGSFYLNRKIRLLELIAFAGGPDVEKSGSKVRIARVGNLSTCGENADSADDDAKVQFMTYNLKDVQDGTQNPWMQPGDVVSVLEADEAYVVGNVFKPAKVSLKEPKTLTQAIAIAGGLDSTANTEKVVIHRQEKDNLNKTELSYNLKDIRDKKIPDPAIQANDIVEVSNDKVKSVRNGLLKALTGGIGNIFLRVPTP